VEPQRLELDLSAEAEAAELREGPRMFTPPA